MPARTYITANQFVVLEYATLTDVMKKKRSGGELTEKEEAITINYEYQYEAWMKNGFISQGHAFYKGCEE